MLKTTHPTVTQPIVEALGNQLRNCQEFPAIFRIEVDLDPFRWLEAQAAETKVVWCDRDSTRPTVGAGEAALVEATPEENLHQLVQRCRQLIGDNDALRIFGGLSFDGGEGWSRFGAGRFVVPRFLLQDGQLHLTVMNSHDLTEAQADLQALNCDHGSVEASLPCPQTIKYLPTREGWQANVDQALTMIRSEVLEKLVLARKASLSFDEPVRPIQVTSHLAKATHDCYIFCFQFGHDTAFVGATPERLFKRSGNHLWSEVVAGTRKRGATSGEDQRLAYELLTSEKDQLEHDIVRKSIRQRLHKLVEHLEVDGHASVLRLAKKQHLCSEVVATLKPGVDEAALLAQLHPTPAVGGYPTENAIPEIARLEPFNRGWYAAPIGWIGRDDAEFAVGIRSGLIDGQEMSLYSGAGIVKGSEPDREWAEIEHKIQDFVDIFGAEYQTSPNVVGGAVT